MAQARRIYIFSGQQLGSYNLKSINGFPVHESHDFIHIKLQGTLSMRAKEIKCPGVLSYFSAKMDDPNQALKDNVLH